MPQPDGPTTSTCRRFPRSISSATLLDSAAALSALAAGKSYTISLSGVAVPNETPGQYYVFVADDDPGVARSVSSAVPLTLTAPNVDLAITGTTVPSTVLGLDQGIKVFLDGAEPGERSRRGELVR